MQFETIDEGRAHKRVMKIDGEEVCHLWVIDYTMRVGTAEVRMAGIGDVYTNRQHRMKGYMRHLFGDSLRYMAEEGYDVSMLFGISNFYTKFGYASSLPVVHFAIETRDAEAAGADVVLGATMRPIEERDMPAVVELYNRKNAVRTGTLVRDPAEFKEFEKGTHWGVPAEAALWEGKDGALLGYAVWDKRPTEVKIAEVEAETPALYPAMLAAFAQQAVDKRCETIEVFAPPNHGFAEYAQRFGITWTLEYPRCADGMTRVMNQQPLMEKLFPVLEARRARLQGSERLDFAKIETDLGVTTLRFDGTGGALEGDEATPGKGVRFALSQDKLSQLIMGYRSIQDVLTDSEVKLEAVGAAEAEATSFLQTLFPQGNAFVWRPDYF